MPGPVRNGTEKSTAGARASDGIRAQVPALPARRPPSITIQAPRTPGSSSARASASSTTSRSVEQRFRPSARR